MSEARIPERFEITFPVAPADIDELGHVNNTVYVRWVQDIAVAHWRASAPEDARAAFTTASALTTTIIAPVKSPACCPANTQTDPGTASVVSERKAASSE